MQNRPGVSLFDLIITLALLAVLAAVAAPSLLRARNGYAARAARDATAALIERARSLASARGSARLIVDPAAAELRLESPAGMSARTPLALNHAFGVQLTVDGHSSGLVQLDFNAMGLGVLANRTIRFQRGQEQAALSLSTYGRARRW